MSTVSARTRTTLLWLMMAVAAAAAGAIVGLMFPIHHSAPAAGSVAVFYPVTVPAHVSIMEYWKGAESDEVRS